MSVTLAEASKLSQDLLLKGVIEEIIKDSPLLQTLPFIEIVGNGLTYNREKTLPGANWYLENEKWAEPTPPEFTIETATLNILGEHADLDNFIKATRSNVQDVEAEVIALTAKAIRYEFEETFLYGDKSVNPKQPDGLRKMIDLTTPGSQVVLMTGTAGGGPLTLKKIEELIDKVQGDSPDALIMSKRTKRKINDLVRAAGHGLPAVVNEYGVQIQSFNGVPLWVTDWQLDTHAFDGSKETATTGGDCSVIYAVRLGEGALAGLQAPGGLTAEPVGQLEGKDATRTRIKWYCSLALFCTVAVASGIGFDDS